MTRRSIGCACALSVAFAFAAALPATSAAGTVCGPTSAKTLKQQDGVRIYEKRRPAFGTYGCMRGVGRSFELDSVDGGEESFLRNSGPIAVAGRFVAFVSDGAGGDGASDYEFTSVDRVDLRTGKRRYSSCTEWYDDEETENNGCGSGLKVSGLVLRRTGGYAYIQRLETTERRVMRVDRRGLAQLDRGTDVEQRSLRLDGRSLSWRRGGATKQDTLY